MNYYYSLDYLEKHIINVQQPRELFLIAYNLNNEGPYFEPNLDVNSEPNFFGLIINLIEDIIEMGSYMERIDSNYPPYNVRN